MSWGDLPPPQTCPRWWLEEEPLGGLRRRRTARAGQSCHYVFTLRYDYDYDYDYDYHYVTVRLRSAPGGQCYRNLTLHVFKSAAASGCPLGAGKVRLRDQAIGRGKQAKKDKEPKEYPLHKGDWSSCDESEDEESMVSVANGVLKRYDHRYDYDYDHVTVRCRVSMSVLSYHYRYDYVTVITSNITITITLRSQTGYYSNLDSFDHV